MKRTNIKLIKRILNRNNTVINSKVVYVTCDKKSVTVTKVEQTDNIVTIYFKPD